MQNQIIKIYIQKYIQEHCQQIMKHNKRKSENEIRKMIWFYVKIHEPELETERTHNKKHDFESIKNYKHLIKNVKKKRNLQTQRLHNKNKI